MIELKCKCGNDMNVSAGDLIIDDDYKWYVTYRCSKCDCASEIDGFGFEDLPKEVEQLIMKLHGHWQIVSNNKFAKTKIKYVLKKIAANNEISYEDNGEQIVISGSENKIMWIQKKLLGKKITDYTLVCRTDDI